MKYVALLRGINVGGNKKVPMADLREMTAKLGFRDPKTLLQSGNLVFDAKAQSTASLERLFEKATLETIGVECSYLVRTAGNWRDIIARNPFADHAKSDPAHVVLTCCRDAPDRAALQALRSEIRGDEDFTAIGNELYVWYPHGIGESRLALALGRNRLGTTCTARNWNTVMKIGVLLPPG